MRRAFFGVVAFGLLLGSGCGSETPCESVCAQANACEVAQRGVDVDCPSYCRDVERLQQRAERWGYNACRTEFKAHLSCWEANSAQLCSKDFKGCEEVGLAWQSCFAKYCTEMDDPNCGDDAPALSPF